MIAISVILINANGDETNPSVIVGENKDDIAFAIREFLSVLDEDDVMEVRWTTP